MASQDEIKDLREKNTELVQKVQFWKMTAAQREKEKLDLMKENNELRLKLSRLRNNGGVLACKLDMDMQSTSEKALAHMVRASGEIARTIELTKAYMRDRQELDAATPRWSSISGTPKMERVHRVPPMMMGGQSIQPVVALSRTNLNASSNGLSTRSPNQNRSVTERALPIHMLQDVYIPLTRIDIGDVQTNNMDADMENNNADDSTEDLGLEDTEEQAIDDSHISEDEEYDSSRRLDVVTEDLELEGEVETPQRNSRSRTENPLEGPSWLLDAPNGSRENTPKTGLNLEPDSTTELEGSARVSLPTASTQRADKTEESGVLVRVSCSFSPTVRRRKRTSSPTSTPAPTPKPTPKPTPTPRQTHYSPRPHTSRSTSGRVLKVLVAKMRLEDDDSSEHASPPKRARSPSPPRPAPAPAPSPSPITPAASPLLLPPAPRASSPPAPPARPVRFDAPSPNGATVAGLIVSEARYKAQTYKQELDQDDSGSGDSATTTSRNSRNVTRRDRRDSHRATNHDSRATNNDSRVIKHENRATDNESRATSRGSHDSRDSDSGSNGGGDSVSEGRTRRPRKAVTYKEKPLNRKMRR